MSIWVTTILRVVIAIALVGSVVVQVAIVAFLWVGTDQEPRAFEFSLVGICVLGVVMLQVVGVCIWKLLTMVKAGTVFSTAAFKYVDTVIAAIGVGAVLTFTIAVVARFANHAAPGDEIAPGLVALICGFALVAAGVAMVVYVMRSLLAQAVERDSEARALQSELDEVI